MSAIQRMSFSNTAAPKFGLARKDSQLVKEAITAYANKSDAEDVADEADTAFNAVVLNNIAVKLKSFTDELVKQLALISSSKQLHEEAGNVNREEIRAQMDGSEDKDASKARIFRFQEIGQVEIPENDRLIEVNKAEVMETFQDLIGCVLSSVHTLPLLGNVVEMFDEHADLFEDKELAQTSAQTAQELVICAKSVSVRERLAALIESVTHPNEQFNNLMTLGQKGAPEALVLDRMEKLVAKHPEMLEEDKPVPMSKAADFRGGTYL